MRPRKVWFGDAARPAFFTRYRQIASAVHVPFMVRRPFSTILLDLSRSPEALLASCAANCRNEIRRGYKEGLTFRAGPPGAHDLEYFGAFMASRGLGRVNLAYAFDREVLVTSAHLAGERLASHLYVMPTRSARARLIYSATAIATTDAAGAEPISASARITGIANRWLHYEDALFLRGRGARLCDLGGLGATESDPKIRGINRFKRSFGGEEITESNYDPVLLVALESALNVVRRLSRRFRP